VNILVAEDDPVTANMLHAVLGRSAHSVVVVSNGVEALEQLRKQPFKLLLTDWMMPEMDGIELLRKVRAEIRPVPVVLMMSSISNPEARQYALRTGADGFLAKPVAQIELLDLIRSSQAHAQQGVDAPPAPSPASQGNPPAAPAAPAMVRRQPSWMKKTAPVPAFPAFACCASTGGPESLRTLFSTLSVRGDVAGFVVIHGPDWMQRQCAELFQRESPGLVFVVAENNSIVEPGHVYIAPGDRHMVVNPGSSTISLLDTPLVNFVRPAADPLFDSVARAFGPYAIGVVLTGLGSDGTAGATAIAAAGGKVFIEDPKTAIAPQMPKSAIEAVGPLAHVRPLAQLGDLLSQSLRVLSDQCRSAQR
jgi:two-component system chemotaxis response regulator CheB